MRVLLYVLLVCVLPMAPAMSLAGDGKIILEVENTGYEAVIGINQKEKYHEKMLEKTITQIRLDKLDPENWITVNGHAIAQPAMLVVAVYHGKKIVFYKIWNGKPVTYSGPFKAKKTATY